MSMVGAWGAKGYITDYLKADLPTRTLAYRNLWNLDDKRLPTVEKFYAYEPAALDTWPCIITVAIATPGINRLDYQTAGDPIYAVTYAMRTYIWTRGEFEEQTTQSRDNLTTVVRSSFLDRPCLRAGVHAYAGIHEISLDEGTLNEQFSDLTRLKGERWLAGAFLGYEFTVHEPVTRTTLGTVATTSASVTLLSLT